MPRDKILPAVTNANGEAIPGALVQVENRLDNSNATVYADETSGTTLSNPVVTDNFGRIPGWLTQGRYNLIITGAGIAAYTQALNVFTPDGPISAGNTSIGTVGPGSQSGITFGDVTNSNQLVLYRYTNTVINLDPPAVSASTSVYLSANGARAQFGYDGSAPAISINDNLNNLNFKIDLSTAGVSANALTLTNAGQLRLPQQGSAAGIQIGNSSITNLYWLNGTTLKTDGNLNIGGQDLDTSLSVAGLQPASVSGNGTTPSGTVSVVGAKGGSTTGTTGQIGGTGASLVYTAGAGGDAPAGSTNGAGGSITLQPGAAGVGLGGAASAGSLNLGIAGCKIGFYGVTAVTRQTGYTITNPTTNRTIDEANYTTDQLAQLLGTLITDLKNTGIIG